MVPRPSEASLRRIKIIGFSFVLVLVPFVIYYYFWVSNQTKYFTGRDLRVLAALTRHVEESVKSQGDVFTNAVKKYLTKLPDKVAQQDTDQTGEEKPATARSRLQNNRDELKEQFQSGSLNPLKADGTNLTITNLDLVAKPTDDTSMDTAKIEIHQEDNARFLYFSFTTTYPQPDPLSADRFNEGKSQEPPLYVNFKVKTDLAGLIGQFVDTRQIEDNQDAYGGDGFDAIVIAEVDEAVNVVFQESSPKLRLASLNNLTAVSDGSKVDLKLLGQSTNMADVKVGAGEYKLFFQPVQLPLARLGGGDRKQINWLACGFVESWRFRRESWAVSYTVLIIFFFLAALVALSWPFLKLLLIGPKDRLRPIDTYLLVVSAVMITALLTLFGVFSTSYIRAEKLLDTELESFAGGLQKNFNAELGSALKEIDDLNCQPTLLDSTRHLLVTSVQGGFRVPKNCPNTQSGSTQAAGERESLFAKEVREAGYSETLRSADRRLILTDADQPKSYPFFTSAFWVSSSGKQQIKWTTRPNLTNNLFVGDRDYFSKPREGVNYTYGDHQFYLQPIVSKTTGQNEVTISKAIAPFEKNRNIVWVSAINTRLLSLMQPVIPSGFGFAVVDETGRVLFHSDEKRHLGENFFEESDNNQELRAAVLGRSNQLLAVNYLGKGHSMYVRPMGVRQFNWTVIAFRNKDYLRTTFSEIMTLCSVLFLAHLILTLIVLLVVYVINRTSREPVAWLWPAPDKAKIYALLTVLNLLLVLIAVLAVRWLPGLWKIAIPVTTSFTALLLYVWTLKRTNESRLSTKLIERLTQRRFRNHLTVYVLNATLLFVIISIIPAYACFKLAYVEEMKLFIKEGQLNLARSMARREDRLRTQYTTGIPNDKQPAMREFLKTRLANTKYDVYQNLCFSTSVQDCASKDCEGGAPRDNKLIRFFKNFVPLFNQSSIQRHALLWPAADQSWKWEERAPDQLILHVGGPLTAAQGTTQLHIVSTLPQMNGSVWWFIWPILLVIVAFLVSYMCRQIFLFKRKETACDELSGFTADSVCQNLFLVLNPPFIGRSELLKRLGLHEAAFERIDIKKKYEVEKWLHQSGTPGVSTAPVTLNPATSLAASSTQSTSAASAVALAPSAANPPALRPIFLDNFDFGIANPDYDQQRLVVLEKLYEQKRLVVAVSNFERETFTNGTTDNTNGKDNVKLSIFSERWMRAISRFRPVSVEDFGERKAFETTIKNRKKQILSDATLASEQKEVIADVFDRIARECAPRACLQSIGADIAKAIEDGIAKQRNISEKAAEGVTKQVLVQALPYYKSIWRVCSDEEKLTLKHLAQDGLLSSNDPDLERLMRKGLIVREPAVRLMNESFRSFVLGINDDEALAHCEEEARKSSNWEVLKVPLSIGVASVIVFLLLTQREIYNSALPIITAITAGVPTFFKLVSVFHGDAAGKAGG